MSVAAYQRVRTIAESPRATEYRLIGQSTGEMIGARDRGLKPILGCEVYVAQGSRFDKSGPQTETNHLVLLAETRPLSATKRWRLVEVI